MEKKISILLVALMAVSCLMLASCGGSDNGSESGDIGNPPTADSPYIGVWQPTGAEIEGEDNVNATFENAPFTLDLREDGTAIVTTDEETTGTWTEKSDGVHVAAGDTDADFRDIDGNLVTDILGIEIVFEKQQ